MHTSRKIILRIPNIEQFSKLLQRENCCIYTHHISYMQCAYMTGVKGVALKAANVLWAHFIETTAHPSHREEIPEYRCDRSLVYK